MCSLSSAFGPAYVVARVAIPPFLDVGYLPPGDYLAEYKGKQVFIGHDATMVEVENRFVGAYPNSTTRARLFPEVEHLMVVARDRLPCVMCCVSGGFVADIENPEDAYVALFVHADALEKLTPHETWLLHRIFDRREARLRKISVYTDLARAWPVGHPRHEEGQKRQLKVRLDLASVVPNANGQGGYVEVMDCEGGEDEIAALIQSLAVAN